jgi:hypothetical protein
MSEQGAERPDSSGIDFTGEMAAAQAAGEAAMTAQTGVLAAAPGLGAAVTMPDPPTSPNYGSGLGADVPRTPVPVAGEGFSHPAPDAPAQTDGRPSYAGPLAGDEDPFLGQP